jgi:predicted MPP superfamily phosphohydrolase
MSPFLLVLTTLSLCAHLLLVRWLLRSFPRLSKRTWLFVAIAIALAMTVPVVRRFVHANHGGGVWSSIYAVQTAELMIVAIGAVPLAIVNAVAWLTEAARPLVPRTEEPRTAPAPGERAESVVGRRRAIARAGGIAVYGVTGTALGWGMVRGRHAFEIEELAVKIPGLPKALDGYTITQISDIHVGAFVGERELEEGLDRVRETKPDLLVVTGDIVDFEPAYAALLARALGRVRVRDGIAAILGNHDYYAGADRVERVMREAGVDLLVNQGRVLRPNDGGGFALLGVDDMSGSLRGGPGPWFDGALRAVPRDLPRILLAHQPPFFDEIAGHVALQLSGHTHGGQINPGFTPARLLMPYVAGRYDALGSTLYVNRGFGVAGPPSRVGAPPEVTKLVLVAA